MSNQVKPEAFFDSISISKKLDDSLDSFKIPEIHLFSYFASLLFIYKGNSLDDWNYKFVIDKTGYPFSEELQTAIDRHIKNGLLESRGDFFVITSRGNDEYSKFKNLPTLVSREQVINAACTTSILVPYSETQRALLNDPELLKAKAIGNNPWIEHTHVYKKFKEISEAVGAPVDDIIIPAVSWINFILQNNAEKID